MIKCNLCWKKFEAQEVTYVTSCCHIFCDDCANKQFSKERICPSCDQSVSSRGGISRNILAVTPDKTVQLCGLTPKEIMSICGKALEFWNYQVQVAFDYERADLGQTQAKMNQLENAYGEKLEESYSKMNSLKRQLDAVLRETEAYKQQIVELEEKYSEKARQKRKLEELYDSLKSKYEQVNGGAGTMSTAYSRNLGTFAIQEEPIATKPRFGRLSPGPVRTVSPKVPTPNKITEDRFLFRRSPAKVLEKPVRSSPGIQQTTPTFASPKRPLFRSVKIPDSPRFSRFGKVFF